MQDKAIEERVRDLFRRIEANGLNNRGPIIGCSEEDVRRLESHLGSALPLAYVTFLRLGGRSLGGFLAGSDLSCADAFKLTGWASEVLAEFGLELPIGAFVFYNHGSYIQCFFLLGDGEDPPVYQFLEAGESGEGPPFLGRAPGTFTDWLQGCIEDDIRDTELYGPPPVY